QSVENFITYTEEQGYIVNFDNLPDEMKYIIRLSDKQVGAIADTVITQESGSSVQLGEESLSVALKQVKFSEITDTGALLNTIIAIDLTTLINQIEGFPYSLFKDKLPNMLYISSIVQIKKGEKAFSYTVLHNSLTINNLNSEESEDLLKTLDILLKIGTAESFNIALGTEIANALIGNDQCNGIAYSLKEIGATDYAFVEMDGVGCFSVLR
ncbi:MAG: hypothetical protein J6Q06_03940, partial [Clostridia bacterium]|nr:hypothetical protein [Clostridia bacterium]